MTAVARPKRIRPPRPPDPNRKLRVRGKVADAIDHVVFHGMTLEAAAKRAHLPLYIFLQALARPHVVRHLKIRREVFRDIARGGNIARLVTIRDAANNQPAVQAIRTLEAMGDGDAPTRTQAAATPGLVIVVQDGARVRPVLEQRALDVRQVGNANDVKT